MTIDYDDLLGRNLASVFSERDADARLRAIDAIYTAEPTLYEPANVVTGRQAISDTIGRLLATLPPEFSFATAGPAVGHHDRACVRWRGGPPNGPAMITGSDVVELEDGKIKAIYVFIDPADA